MGRLRRLRLWRLRLWRLLGVALLIAGSPRSALDGQLTASRVALKAADQSLAVVVDLDQRAMAVGAVVHCENKNPLSHRS